MTARKNRSAKPNKSLAKCKAPILDKDQKILWARAAGLCSICRAHLTFDEDSGEAGTLGQMAHIVGEKATAARGDSNLPIKERNRYPNLILLCGHDHDTIDKKKSQYSVARLHQIKVDHEQWVRETLANTEPAPDDLVYSHLIDTITLGLQLDHWYWFIDNAVRDLLPTEIADFDSVICRKLTTTIWPKKNPKFRRTIESVMNAFHEYICHFMTRADISSSNKFLRPDRSWARYSNPDFAIEERAEETWSKKNFWLLCALVVELNRFAAAVREFSNPLFFRIQGDFPIYDSMGYRFGGKETVFKPTKRQVTLELKRLEQV